MKFVSCYKIYTIRAFRVLSKKSWLEKSRIMTKIFKFVITIQLKTRGEWIEKKSSNLSELIKKKEIIIINVNKKCIKNYLNIWILPELLAPAMHGRFSWIANFEFTYLRFPSPRNPQSFAWLLNRSIFLV